MTRQGDGASGAGGAWTINPSTIVCADRTAGAGGIVQEVVNIINNAGHNATAGEVDPSAEYHAISGKTNTTVFWIVNGVDQAMCYYFAGDVKDGGWMGSGNNIVVGFLTANPGVCSLAKINNKSLGAAHDDNYSDGAARSSMSSKSSGEWVCDVPNSGWVAGPDANSLAQAFLSGKGSGGSGGANVVEGHIFSHKGETPQFWNVNTYTPYERIDFINFTMEDEYPRVRTATFETPVNIDLTMGRVAVLITGDCNDFGGIIIKKDYDAKNKIYKYQCQGFMERIMASPVYVIANGGHTAHHLISEYLDEIGLPSINLGEEDDYDVFVDDETKELLKKEKDSYDSVDAFNSRNDLKIKEDEVTGILGDNSSSSSEDSESNEGDDSESETKGKIVLETKSHDDEYEVINTFKAKPVGLYDKFTGGDFIRTLILDYGINVDFYGDVNGIPCFDVMDMEEWKNTGWYISGMGYGDDYEYTFDITNAVTQVGVKNISAINGNGELYTSQELLGVNLEKFVGRMGTIVDNPNAKGSSGGVDQVQSMYMGEDGQQYSPDKVITTNGEPSCGKCKEANGGSKPEQKKYTKYWVNKCPGCETESKLKSVSDGHGKTVCEECNKEYCQFCGYDISGGNLKLISCTPSSGVTSATTDATTDTTDTSTTSGSNSSSKSSGNKVGKTAKRRAIDKKETNNKKATKTASSMASNYKKVSSSRANKTKKLMGH